MKFRILALLLLSVPAAALAADSLGIPAKANADSEGKPNGIPG
jgi:hypothetical protein